MSMAKRLKRKQVLADRKKAGVDRNKLLKLNFAGEQIAEKNLPRIEKYCHAYWFPMFCYVMRKTFGFGFDRMNKMHDGIVHIFDVLREPRFLKLEWLEEGFDIECNGFKLDKQERLKQPKSLTLEGFSEMYAYNASLTTLENLEIVWLWVLHDTFGFGKDRLMRASVAIVKLQKMPEKVFNYILEDLEKVKAKGKSLNFQWVRDTMKELSVDGYTFDDGLVLLR